MFMRLTKFAVVAGFALMAIAAFLTWSDNPPFSENGIDRSAGVVTLVIAIGCGLIALLDRRPRGMLIAVSAGALALILTVADYADISGNSGASVGTGLLLSIVGAAIATVAAGVSAFSTFKKPAAPASDHS
jgi:hypothetical protein